MTRDTPRTRLEPADRRRELLTVAERLASEGGIASLSTQAVATVAGSSKALVFHYFGSVVGLQRAVVSEAVDDLLDALGPPRSPGDRECPVVVLDAFLSAVAARRELWTDIWRGALHDDEQTQAILADARSTLVERLARRSSELRGPSAPPASPPAPSTSPATASTRESACEPAAHAQSSPAPVGSEELALLSRGWVALAENATATWLAGSPLSRSALRDLLVRSLVAVLGDAARETEDDDQA